MIEKFQKFYVFISPVPLIFLGVSRMLASGASVQTLGWSDRFLVIAVGLSFLLSIAGSVLVLHWRREMKPVAAVLGPALIASVPFLYVAFLFIFAKR